MRLFSTKHRPPHLGPYPLERLSYTHQTPDLQAVPTFAPLLFRRPDAPLSIVNAMGEYQAMLDAIRIGFTNKAKAGCPDSQSERAEHLKAFGYFNDASAVTICKIPDSARLQTSFRNPDIDRLADDLKHRQTKTLAAGIDLIMADLRESMEAPPTSIREHKFAVVFAYEYPRDPAPTEPGVEWLDDAQAARAALRAAETSTVIANYIRLLGYESRSHSASTSDVDLNQLAVASGLAVVQEGKLVHPYLGDRFGMAAVTTTFELACDSALSVEQNRSRTHGFAWRWGKGTVKGGINAQLFAKRRFVDSEHPFEKLRRTEKPTTYIDEDHVARVPKRTDMFARSQFGDFGKINQNAAKGGHYVSKAAPSMAQRRVLGACIFLQDGACASAVHASAKDAERNANNVKAAAYFLGVDAVGLSRCPDWTWYSHDATGAEIHSTHDQAISMIIDQGFETMEGASGDDWIAVAQSMRAYLRFSVLGGVIAKQIRNLGYEAKAHTVLDGEVLQPPLLLLAGLGEVSRIGEVILNPYLGPRLKSGVVTTNMPITHDKPIDFGLQKFCERCNKCARECPSGAITAGPKLMFNGYEIWKSDSQKCTTYRLTTEGGAMCGRCMKTCPWNLEGLFTEKPFRWSAMNLPWTAPLLAKLDDTLGHGERNAVKKWWWDLERDIDGGYHTTEKPINIRGLQKDLKVSYDDQTLAVYPANLAPPPWPYPFPANREKGIEAYETMVTADEYRSNMARGKTGEWRHEYTADEKAPVLRVKVSRAFQKTDDTVLYELRPLNGKRLPAWQAGAHIDVVVAPEYLRQYSLCGNPADRSVYEIAVLKEDEGRGGSLLLQRIFTEGRKIFISEPINHFPLIENASQHILVGGGIGVTPFIAMAHELHLSNASFELHYCVGSRQSAAFIEDLSNMPWKDSVVLHISSENSRADFPSLFKAIDSQAHLYFCGSEPFMAAANEAALGNGIEEERIHQEFFSVPETPDYENYAFKIKLSKNAAVLEVPADQSASDVLINSGYDVSVKCSDGLCGVCKCTVLQGEVEHRDFVLSKKQRETEMILCQSRAKSEHGVIEIDL